VDLELAQLVAPLERRQLDHEREAGDLPAEASHQLRRDHLGTGTVLRLGAQHEALVAGEVGVALVIVVIDPGREAAAERGGWGKPAPKGIFRGIAQMKAFNSYVAACAEVSVDGNNVKVHRIVGATDCGYAVNPAQIERQVAGSFVYGFSALFMQENTVKGGRIVARNTRASELVAGRPE